MRPILIVLALLLVLVQYPLWLGKGGWLRVAELERLLADEQGKNQQLKTRNERLASELRDLKDGTAAVEERARNELGMMRDGEVFVQFIAPSQAVSAAAAASAVVPQAASVASPQTASPLPVKPRPATR